MMNKMALREIVQEQNGRAGTEKMLIERDVLPKIEKYMANPFVIVISGIRRCGKSTLIGQVRKKHPGHYLNFDDERLADFELRDFEALHEIFIELYGDKSVFYFDEIQNVSGWERFVRRLHEMGKKVFVTGSNSSMLSMEYGTHLTGRYLPVTLMPFSFGEFLRFRGFRYNEGMSYTSGMRAGIKMHFGKYLAEGGLPEYIADGNPEYLKIMYENILYRDVIARHGIANQKALKELVRLTASNISKDMSFNSLKNTLNLGSPTTVREYFGFLEGCFLLFLVPKFDYSLKRQVYAGKKAYIIDNALAVSLGYRMSGEHGRLLENAVFLELMRRGKETYYFQGRNECDFVIRKGYVISEAIQVCYDLNRESMEREKAGLVEAMKKFSLKKGLILTYDQEDEISEGGVTISIVPAWKWLLSSDAWAGSEPAEKPPAFT